MQQELIGNSPQIKDIRELIKVVADTALSVVIYGETGAGKEVVAKELHRQSDRRKKKFVKVNCAALPTELLESELFGYDRGAFTGATRFKPGKFEIASDGVIFLDEIGDIPLPLQAKLLQVLQSGEFSRLGGKDVKVDTWVISATNHDLAQDMREGRFREDLYYRLNIIKIDVPPLRDRKEDIPLLTKHFIERYSSELEIEEDFHADPTMMDLFETYDWPGNIRELSNTIQRLMVLREWDGESNHQNVFQRSGIPVEPHTDSGELIPLKELKSKAEGYIEKKLITYALSLTAGNKVKAAKMLDISYKTLFYKMNELGLR